MAEGVTTSEARVYDTREASVSVEGAPELYTAAGRDPIDPYYVQLHYNIVTGELRDVIVLGRTDHYPIGMRGSGHGRLREVRRRVTIDRAPEWLRDLIEQYRPTYTQETTDQ